MKNQMQLHIEELEQRIAPGSTGNPGNNNPPLNNTNNPGNEGTGGQVSTGGSLVRGPHSDEGVLRRAPCWDVQMSPGRRAQVDRLFSK